MTLRCRRCNRSIKAQTLIGCGILVSYGPTCARIVFAMPARKAARILGPLPRHRRPDAGDTSGQMLLELECA